MGMGWVGKIMFSTWVMGHNPPPYIDVHVRTVCKSPREISSSAFGIENSHLPCVESWDAWQRRCILYELEAENTNQDYL